MCGGALSLIVFAAWMDAQSPEPARVAATPPMGWNSWDCYGTTVTEAEVKANADYMAKNLKAHGWRYIVVDIQWSEPNPQAHGYRPDTELAMDGFGRLIRPRSASRRRPAAAASSRWRITFTAWGCSSGSTSCAAFRGSR